MNFDAAALAYVRYVLDEKRLTPGALAQKSGISASTLTRALNDPKHKYKLSMTTLEKIASFSGISPARFLEARDTVELTLADAHEPATLNPGDREAVGLYDAGYKFTFIIGDVEAGKWTDPGVFNYMEYGPLHLTHTIRSPKECFCYAIRDSSADMIADEGDILFCTKVNEDDIESWVATRPDRADNYAGPVVVERRSKDAFKVEHTVRFIRRRRDSVAGWELVSAHYEDHFPSEEDKSNKGKRKKPLIQRIVIDRFGGNEEVRVVAQVEHVIRGDTTDALNWLLFDYKS